MFSFGCHPGQKGDKPAGNRLFDGHFLTLPPVTVQDLIVALADGNQEVAAVLELRNQMGRHAGSAGGDHDGVEGGMVVDSFSTVVGQDIDVLYPQLGQHDTGTFGEGPESFHRYDAAGEPGQDGGLVTRPGAHLQNMLVALEFQQGGHQADGERLADGLPMADGQGAGLMGAVLEQFGNEEVSGHFFHGCHDAAIADTGVGQLSGSQGKTSLRRNY